MSGNTKTPAAEGTATGMHENIICNREKERPCYDDYSTMPARCQEVTIPRREYDMLMDRQFRYDMLKRLAEHRYLSDIEKILFEQEGEEGI